MTFIMSKLNNSNAFSDHFEFEVSALVLHQANGVSPSLPPVAVLIIGVRLFVIGFEQQTALYEFIFGRNGARLASQA